MLTAARTTPVHPGAVVPAAVLPPGCRHQYSGRNSRGSGLFTHLSPRSSYPEGPGANHAEDSRLCIAAAYAVVLSSYCSICVCEVVQRWAIAYMRTTRGSVFPGSARGFSRPGYAIIIIRTPAAGGYLLLVWVGYTVSPFWGSSSLYYGGHTEGSRTVLA